MTTLDLTADIIDIRDITERYEELEAIYGECPDNPAGDDAEEFAQLSAILEELKGNHGDEQWRGDWYPLILIHDGSAFEEYMDELLEGCGDIPELDKLPSYVRITIDYDQLKWDYTTIEIDGEDYLYR